MYDYQCPECGYRFESLQKMDVDTLECPKCNAGQAKRDDVPKLTHFDSLGTHANLSSLRLHFNWPES